VKFLYFFTFEVEADSDFVELFWQGWVKQIIHEVQIILGKCFGGLLLFYG